MSSRRIVVSMLVTLGVVACGQDDVTGPSPTPTPSFRAERSVSKRYDLAMGSVQVEQFGLGHRYSFFATAEPGALSADGTWTWVGRHPDATWQASGTVICMRVVGNVAHISGVIEQTDAYWAQPPFNYATWSVRDMGNKKKSPPDHASLMNIAVGEAQARAHCATDSFLLMVPVTSGEVVVRPAKVKGGGGDDGDDDDDNDDDDEDDSN